MQWNKNSWASSLIPFQSPLERNGVVLPNPDITKAQAKEGHNWNTETRQAHPVEVRLSQVACGPATKRDVNLPMQCVRTSLGGLCFDDPLMKVMVPEMVTKLKQGVGRLIRNFTDTGIISIIDPRLKDANPKPYCDVVWKALPISNRTNDLQKLKEFYERLSQ